MARSSNSSGAKAEKCKICNLIAKSSKRSIIKLDRLHNQISANSNNNNNSISQCKRHNAGFNIDYVSLTSLNKIQSSKCKPIKNYSCIDAIDLDRIISFKKASNIYCLKIVSIILFHYIILISYILFLLKNSHNYSLFINLKVWHICLSYFGILILILSIPNLRSTSPINYLMFILYTIVLGNIYWFLSYNYRITYILFNLFITLGGQVIIILFCMQVKFTLCSRPVIPYLYLYFILIVLILILFVGYGYMKFFFIQLFIYFNLNPEINLNGSFTGFILAFVFLFYEIFDLQLIIANKFSNTNTCEQSKFTYAFDLITVDLVKILLYINQQILKLAK